METKVKRVGANFRTKIIAYYGPDNKIVTKAVVGITMGAGKNFIKYQSFLIKKITTS